jgi:predicted ATPase
MDGSGRPVWIEGEPGIGKSALLASFLAEAEDQGCRVLAATAYEYGRRIPLHVMTECLDVVPGSEDHWGLAADRITHDTEDAAERLLALVRRSTAAGPVVLVPIRRIAGFVTGRFPCPLSVSGRTRSW